MLVLLLLPQFPVPDSRLGLSRKCVGCPGCGNNRTKGEGEVTVLHFQLSGSEQRLLLLSSWFTQPINDSTNQTKQTDRESLRYSFGQNKERKEPTSELTNQPTNQPTDREDAAAHWTCNHGEQRYDCCRHYDVQGSKSELFSVGTI